MSAGAARERRYQRALRANGGVGGLTACRPSLRYHLLDEWRLREPAADNTVSDIIEIESSPGPRHMQGVLHRLAKRLAGPENRELRRALSIWIGRVVLPRLAPGANLTEVNNLEEIDTMLSGTVITWAERARKDGMEEGRSEIAQRTLERQLTRRFGPLPPEAVDRIRQAALPQLETWLDRIIDAPSMQAVFEEH